MARRLPGQGRLHSKAGYMAAPERFAESQIPLAPRAPSIHGPSRRFRYLANFRYWPPQLAFVPFPRVHHVYTFFVRRARDIQPSDGGACAPWGN
jgi:hypothetical protein